MNVDELFNMMGDDIDQLLDQLKNNNNDDLFNKN